MITNKEIKTLEKSIVELTVTIGKDAVKSEYSDLLNKYAKNAAIKGFRKGKVPTGILERKYKESLTLEAGYNVIEKGLEEALKDVEKKPLPYSTPKLKEDEEFKVDMEQDLTFTVTYETFPGIILGEYKGLEIEIPEVVLTAEDEEKELKKYQEQNAVVADKKDNTVEKDNVVTINYCEADENGNDVEGTSREDFTFTVGTGYNYYKIDEDVIGLKTGEEVIKEKEFPEDFEYKELAGRKIKVKIKVTAVKEKNLPAIDDELAQDISDKYKTLDDLKKDIKERQKGMIESKLKAIKQDRIISKIIESSTVDVPESMVEQELEHSWNNFLYQFGGDEKKVLELLAMQNKTKNDLLDEWKASAEKRVKGQLIASKITEEEKIDTTDEEIEEEIVKQAAQSGMAEEEFRNYIESNDMKDYIRHGIKERKTYDMLVEAGTLKKGDSIKFLDFIQLRD